MPDRRVSIVHVTPAAFSTVVGILGATLMKISGFTEIIETPFFTQEDLLHTVLNSVMFIAPMLAGTLTILLLVKLRKLKIITIMFMATFMLSSLAVYESILTSLAFLLRVDLSPYAPFYISLSLSLVSTLIVFGTNWEAISFLILVLVGSLIGSLLSVMLPSWSIVALAIILAAYDYVSVRSGPLKHIIEEGIRPGTKTGGKGTNPFKGAIVPFRGVSIGLGDIIFYSALSSAATLYPRLSLTRGLLVAAPLCMGVYMTLRKLEKRSYIAALPLPVAFAIATYLSLRALGV